MTRSGKIHNEATTTRILNAGFRAVAEYDRFGDLVGYRGTLSRSDSWSRAQQIAMSRGGIEAEQKATALILSDMFVAALDLDGGGTLLAIVERPLADAAAVELTKALDGAVGDYIGPVPAPLAVLVGVLIIAVLVLGD